MGNYEERRCITASLLQDLSDKSKHNMRKMLSAHAPQYGLPFSSEEKS